MMSAILNPHLINAIVNSLDRLSRLTGKLAGYLCLVMAAVTGLVVLLRYGFNIGSVALQETISYLHAAVFMLGAAYTLQRGAHVRVDIFYRRCSRRSRAWIDSVGAIVFLMPLCVFIASVSWDYMLDSWSVRESSADPGGLPAVFLLKTLIPVMAITLMLQGFAEILRKLAILLETDGTGNENSHDTA
jgi:TRAP-type mannitol/chloroaromatic compound transport system permease small subunit